MSSHQTRTPALIGKASLRDAMGLLATGAAVSATSHYGRHQSPKPKRNDSASPSRGNAIDDLNTGDDNYFAADDTWIE